MKTTIEIPDAILREAKSVAASRGESMREFFENALRGHLASLYLPEGEEPWRAVFGKAEKGATAEVDAVVKADCERIDYESWR